MKFFLINPNLNKVLVKAVSQDRALELWYEATQNNEIEIKEITEAHADVKIMHGMEVYEN